MVLNKSTTSSGFLSGFIESSVEMSPDGSNGECIVHYAGEHSKYELVVTLVGGVREGEAMLVNDGVPFIRLEFKGGLLTDVVERMNAAGSVELRGHLIDGVENGLFEEFDNNRVVWRGFYMNGKRNGKGEIVDEEATVEVNARGNDTAEVIVPFSFVSKKEEGKKDGMVYERDENQVIRRGCWYENGEMKRVVQEFNGSTMIEYDENGRKVYEGEYKGDVENGFVRDGKGKEYLLIEDTGKPKSSTCKSLLCCWMRKGGNELVTKRHREEVVNGLWRNGVYYYESIPSSLTSNPQTIVELEIENNSYNSIFKRKLKLSGWVRLKRIVIGDGCFRKVRMVVLDELIELESIVIGQRSFTYAKTKEDIWNSKRRDGTCRIVNCPKLKSIQIGDCSFSDYHSFELNNLPSLQSIDIGEWCFYWAPSFSLTGLID